MRKWQWGFTLAVAVPLGVTWAVAFPEFSWRQIPLGLLVLFVSVGLVLLVTMLVIPEAYAIREQEAAGQEDFFTMRERVALNDLREAVWDAVQVIPAPRVADYVLTVIHETEDDGA